ncbi:MAG: hypothetical protein IT306_22030 [Chloroflexi bacterium]|nr:hypothetical protein [Chloroflexota bacterium]
MFHGLPPSVPEAAQPDQAGPRFVNLPPGYGASLYQSPTDGPFLAEWSGGTPMTALGQRFEDGHARWQLARDPLGNEGWIADLFLSEQPPDDAPPDGDESYLSAVSWAGEIVICANPAGGPPGLDGDDFVTLVAVAVARWQATADGLLPLRTTGRCEADPNLRGDKVNVVGWTPDVGLVIAGLAWPDADSGTLSETDVMLSRGYFERLHAQRPGQTIRACAFSTLVHELGHVIGLDHPRSRLLKSSMQAVGASRCDKAIPSASDRAQLLKRYSPSGQEQRPTD